MPLRPRCPLVVLLVLLVLLVVPAAGHAQTVPRDMEVNPFGLDGGGVPSYARPLTVFNLYLERNWDAYPGNLDRAAIDARMAALLASGYDSKLRQYSVPGLVWGGSATAPRPCSPSARGYAQPMNTFDVIGYLQCVESHAPAADPAQPVPPAGGVPDTRWPHPNATGTVIYNVVLPKGVQIEMFPGSANLGLVSCPGFGGFHFMTTSKRSEPTSGDPGRPEGRPIYFSIIPTECTESVAGTVGLISHELTEAATDPLPLAHWIDQSSAGVDPGSLGQIWSIQKLLSQGEAADLCQFTTGTADFQRVPLTIGGLDLLVASYWSNDDDACVIGDRRVVAGRFSVDAASLPPGIDPAGVRVVVDGGPPQPLPTTQAVLEGAQYTFVGADGNPLPATVEPAPGDRWTALDCAGAVPFPPGNVDGNAESSVVCRYRHELRLEIRSSGLLNARAIVSNAGEVLGLVGDAAPLAVWLRPGTPLDLRADAPLGSAPGFGFVFYLFLGFDPPPPATLSAPVTITARFKAFHIPRCMGGLLIACPLL